MNERGWDPHTWATKLSNTPFFSSPFPSSSPHSVAGLLVQPSHTQPETAAADFKKKKKTKRREKKENRKNGKWEESKTTYLNLSLFPFLLSPIGFHLKWQKQIKKKNREKRKERE